MIESLCETELKVNQQLQEKDQINTVELDCSLRDVLQQKVEDSETAGKIDLGDLSITN